MTKYIFEKKSKDTTGLKMCRGTVKGKTKVPNSKARETIKKSMTLNGLDKEFELIDDMVECFGFKKLTIELK